MINNSFIVIPLSKAMNDILFLIINILYLLKTVLYILYYAKSSQLFSTLEFYILFSLIFYNLINLSA